MPAQILNYLDAIEFRRIEPSRKKGGVQMVKLQLNLARVLREIRWIRSL